MAKYLFSKSIRLWLLLAIIMMAGPFCFAQLTGTKTIPGDYASIALAITDLNTNGVGAGGVTFNVAANYTETFASPTAGLITATGTSANPIIFQKSGSGANPLVTAGIGTGALDGIFVIAGGDYITFDAIDVVESAGNTDNTTRMEWGYALLKKSSTAPVDGCQYVVIKNSAITLNKAHTVTHGIYAANHITTSSSSVTLADSLDAMNNCKFFGNTISNVYIGVRLAGSSTAALYDKNNEVGVDGGNSITNYGGGSVTTYGIYAIYQNNLKLANNTINGAGHTSTNYGIYTSTGTNSNVDIYGNTVTTSPVLTTSATYGINNAMGGTGIDNTVNIYDNILENCNITATSGTFYGIYNSTSPFNVNIYNNIVRNNTKSGTGSVYLIYNSNTGANGFETTYNNSVYNNTNTGAATMYCLESNPVSTSTKNIYGNNIYNNSTGSTLYGLYNALGNVINISKNNIYNLTTTSASSLVYGIYQNSGTTVNFYNNFVSDLKAPDNTNVNAVNGIYLSGGTNVGLYYNTVFLNAVSSSATTFGSSGVYASSTPTVEMINNIIVNLSTPAGTGNTVAYRRSSTTLTSYSALSNNNNFYAGVPDTSRLIFFDGTNEDQFFADFQSRVAPRDEASLSHNPAFVNSTTPPYNLHIDTAIPTPFEGGGIPVAAVMDDFDGDARNDTTPDIGADEFFGTAADVTPPAISYTPLNNSSLLTYVTLTANITDQSGIASGLNIPRLYYKKYSDASYVYDAAPMITGDDYTFTLTYSNLGGVTIGDTIVYYVAAQDNAGNVSTNPAGGSGVNPPGTTAPTVLNNYLITDLPLAGTYTVGLAEFNRVHNKNVYMEKVPVTVQRNFSSSDSHIDLQGLKVTDKDGKLINTLPAPDAEVTSVKYVIMENERPFDLSFFTSKEFMGVYPTVTAAVNDLNLRGMSGPVVFSLVDNNYPTETYPIDISQVVGSSSTNTITIKPAVGVSTIIPGDTSQPTSTFRLGGADYVTIDGSNTAGGNTINLMIKSQATSAPALHFYGGATHNVIKNVHLESQNTSTGSGTLIMAAGDPNTDNSFENLVVRNYEGSANQHEVGVYFWSSNLNSNNTFKNLEVVNFAYRGFLVQGGPSSDITIEGCTIYNTIPSDNTTIYGIYLAYTPNAKIISNKIYDIMTTGSNPTISGIHYFGSTGKDMTVLAYNNVISLGAGLTTGTIRGIDYYAYAANSFEQYFNTAIILGTDVTAGSSGAIVKRDAAANYISFDNLGFNTRSNISGTGKHHGMIVSNTTGTIISLNYNDYYATGTGGHMALWSSTDYDTLSSWIAAVSKDSNSISSDPLLSGYMPTAASPLLSAGVPVTGITTDITGAVRSVTTPTIGAYENAFDPVVDWANLQWPATINMTQGDTVVAYAQAWISGVTELPGQADGLNCWIGISTTNTNPSGWTTWIEAPFNVQAGNNDEFWAHFGSSLAPGTYYYASRFQYLGGSYRYGGFNGGFWDGTTNISGVLTVTAPILIATNWERSAATTTLPTWFSTANNERGLGWGRVNIGTDNVLTGAVFVVSRNGGLFVKVLNDSTGADIADLITTGIAGGTFALNDVEVTEDGKILGANVTTNAATTPFRVYIWDTPASAPDTAIEYLGTEANLRLGDKITVTGSYSAGTAVLYAASATTGIHKVYKFTMTGGTFNSVPEVIVLSDGITTGIGSASVAPLPNGDFYWNSGGQSARKYQANGTLIGIIPGSVIATGSNAIRYLGKVDTVEYIATFQYGGTNENARVVGIPESGIANAFTYGITTKLGSNANTGGTGDVAFKLKEDGTADVFVLSTNNGLGSYRTLTPVPVELNSFAANVNDRSVELLWSTATESNTSMFQIERNNSSNWSVIAEIRAAGTSTEKKDYTFSDINLTSGKYSYRLKMVDFDGSFKYSNTVEAEIGVPVTFAMSQNYPNPFNPTTRINYQIPVDANVTIELFDITGQRVATLVNQELKAGYHTLEVSGLKLSSGMYIYRINAVSSQNGTNFMDVKKMMMLK